MSEWQPTPRPWPVGAVVIVALAGLFAVFGVVWSIGSTGGFVVAGGPNGEGCRVFWGEAPESVGWSPAGEFLAVTTHDAHGFDSGDPGVRVFRWPGMALVSQTEAYASLFTIDDLGVLTWQSETSTLPAELVTWRMEPGREPVVDTILPGPAVSGATGPGAAVSAMGVRAAVQRPDPEAAEMLCVQGPVL